MGKRGTQRDAERKGWGEAGVQRGMRGSTERGADQQDHLRGRSGLRRQHFASFEIISRNSQT